MRQSGGQYVGSYGGHSAHSSGAVIYCIDILHRSSVALHGVLPQLQLESYYSTLPITCLYVNAMLMCP